MSRLRELFRSRGFLVALTVLNTVIFACTVYLTLFMSPVIVDGHSLNNCTSVREPDRIVWTCGP